LDKKYKIWELIVAFDNKELRQVRKMLKSPYFNYRSSLITLFESIVRQKEKKRESLDLQLIFNKTFPNEKYDPSKLRGHMSDLHELLENWLVMNFQKDRSIEKRLILSNIYRQKKLAKNYHSNIRKTDKLLAGFPLKNQTYYDWTLQLHEEKMLNQASTKRTEDLFFQEISETTDISFLIQKLKNACSLLTHLSVYKTEYDFGLLKFFIDDLPNTAYMKVPAVAMYYYCFRFLQEEKSLESFQRFKQILKANRTKFSKEDLKGPFLLGINFCIKKLNKGSREFAEEGLDLYKEGLEQRILFENNQLTRFTYNNIVAMALFLDEFEWLQTFIEKESDHLEPKYREATISFNKARLSFARKDYGAALVHLQSAEYKDLVNNLISKLLLIQIYFELDEIDILESHLDSFQKFIRRREVSDYHRTNFVNIIGFVRRLIGLPLYDKTKKEELHEQISKENVLSIKGWLLDKTK